MDCHIMTMFGVQDLCPYHKCLQSTVPRVGKTSNVFLQFLEQIFCVLIDCSICLEALPGGSMFPCSLKIKPNVSLFLKSNFPIYFPMFPKNVLKLMFPCSLEVNCHVPLFPGSIRPFSLVPQNPLETICHIELSESQAIDKQRQFLIPNQLPKLKPTSIIINYIVIGKFVKKLEQ